MRLRTSVVVLADPTTTRRRSPLSKTAEFARRCKLMRDEEGRAMLDELARQLRGLGAYIADVADALGLTAARSLDVMALRPSYDG